MIRKCGVRSAECGIEESSPQPYKCSMGNKRTKPLSHIDAFRAIHDILSQAWDPIGVGDEPLAHNEYDSYIPTIYRFISDGCDLYKLTSHLQSLASKSMGLRGLTVTREYNEIIAAHLINAVRGE